MLTNEERDYFTDFFDEVHAEVKRKAFVNIGAFVTTISVAAVLMLLYKGN